MNASTNDGVRRRFLKTLGATAALGVSGLGDGVGDALAQRSRVRKLPLSERSLNSLVPRDPGELRARALEAKRDLKGFIRGHFSLTPSQAEQLDALSPGEVALIHRAIDHAVSNRKGIRIRFLPRTAGSPFEIRPVRMDLGLPPALGNVYIDGEISPPKVVIGIKGAC